MHEAITTIGNILFVIFIACLVFWAGNETGRTQALTDVINEMMMRGDKFHINHVREMRDGKHD